MGGLVSSATKCHRVLILVGLCLFKAAKDRFDPLEYAEEVLLWLWCLVDILVVILIVLR